MSWYFPTNLSSSKYKLSQRLALVLLGVIALVLALLPLPASLAAGQDGAVDPTFMTGNGPNNSVRSVAIQSDGKVLIVGQFTTYNGVGRNYIARLKSDGSLDTTFNVGTGANNSVRNVAIQSNGKVLIVGFFTTYNGVGCNFIARLKSDGSLDTSFNVGTGANGSVQSVAIQSDGKVIIGGFFTAVDTAIRKKKHKQRASAHEEALLDCKL